MNRATTVIAFYLQTLFEKAGLEWKADNAAEIEDAIGGMAEKLDELEHKRFVDDVREEVDRLTGFETEGGPCYLKLSELVGVSQPVQKGARPVCRAIMLAGGHKVYVTENEHNRAKLLELLPADAPALAMAAPPKPSRGPGRPRRAPAAPEEGATPKKAPAGPRALGKRRGHVTSKVT